MADILGFLKRKAQQAGFNQYFLPTLSQTAAKIPEIPQVNQNFVQNRPVAGNLARAGRFVANQGAGIVNSVVGQGIMEPTRDVFNMANSTIHNRPIDYNTLHSAPVRLGANLAGMNRTPQQIIGNIAGTAMPIINAYGGGKGAELLTEKQGLKTLALQGAKSGFKIGGAYGGLSALDENRNQSLGTQLKSGVIGAGEGAVFGAAIGGATPVIGEGLRLTGNALNYKNKYNTLANLMDKPKETSVSRSGIFAPGGETQMTPKDLTTHTQMTTHEFEQKFVGKTIPKDFQIHSGSVDVFTNPDGSMASWSTDNPKFASYIQGKKFTMGQSIRNTKPSETPLSNEAKPSTRAEKKQGIADGLLDPRTKLPKKTSLLKETAGTVPKETVSVPPPTSQAPQMSKLDNQNVSFGKSVSQNTPFYNSNNLNVSKKGKQIVDKTITEIAPQIEKTVGNKLSNKEIIDVANQTSKTLSKTIGVDQTIALGAQQLKVRQQLADIANQGKVTPEFIDLLQKDKAFAENTARLLQQRNIGADPNSNQMQIILENVLKQNKNTDEILNAAKGVDFNDSKQASEFYRTFVKPKASEWIDSLRYNSMLSSPNTHINNAFSNTLQSIIVKPVEKTITGAVDFLSSKVTGNKRTAFAGEGAAYVKGFYSSLGEASHKFADVMRGKSMSTNLDVRQVPLATVGGKGVISKALSYPTRLLEASDQFFTALAKGGESKSLQLKANNGIKVGNIETQALENAKKTLFRQDLNPEGQGHILGAIDHVTGLLQQLRSSDNPVVSNVAKFTVPFIKTPMNIFKQGIEYSPAGITTMWGAGNKSEQLSKAIIGSSVFAGAATLLGAGRLTWGEPTSEKQRNAFRSAGMQPYSVKIGDKWIAYSKLGPLAFPIAMVAAIDDAEKNKKLDASTTEQVLSGIAKYGQFLADQSYAKNVGDLISAAKGGESGISNLLGNYPQQLVPYRALLGWVARMTDPTQRKVDPQGSFIDKQVQQLMMNIPGLTGNAPARVDQFGQPIVNSNSTLNAFSPLKVTTENPENKQLFNDIIDQSRLAKEKTQLSDALKSGKDIQGGKIEPNVYRLSDGTYQYKVGKDTKNADTLDAVHLDIRKNAFEQSGQKSLVDQELGVIFTKTKTGVSTEPIADYQKRVLDQQITNDLNKFQAQNDFPNYMKVLNYKIQSLQKEAQAYDPTTEQDKILKANNDLLNLYKTYNKYNSYGGFKKPKASKKAKKLKLSSVAKKTSFKTGGNKLGRIKRQTSTIKLTSQRIGKGL